MAQELYEYIYNVEHRPNKTGVLLAIPMYMYRIETFKIEYGINFFQKAVLMFKTKPGIDNSTIANCLGLDEELVNMVSEQLVTSKKAYILFTLTTSKRQLLSMEIFAQELKVKTGKKITIPSRFLQINF